MGFSLFLPPLVFTSSRACITILFSILKSFMSAFSILESSVSALRPASRQTRDISAPERPSDSIASSYKSTSAESGIFLNPILRMCNLASTFGRGTFISLSNLPGLKRAESIMSSLFVAAITITFARDSTPSISLSN